MFHQQNFAYVCWTKDPLLSYIELDYKPFFTPILVIIVIIMTNF